MKRLLSISFFIVLAFSVSFGQTYKKGNNNLNIGIGPGLAGIYGSSSVPGISAGYQVGVHEKFSVGGIVGYSSSSYGGAYWNGAAIVRGDWTYSYIFIGARGEYHFVDANIEDLDLYAGLTLGYNIVSVSTPSGYVNDARYYTSEGSYLLYGFHVGGRYYFTPKIGAFLELGYGVGYIVVGGTFRL
jgi:hypothetical protein